MNTTIGFIGTGNIAAAVVEGLVTAAGPAPRILVSPRNATKSAELSRRFATVTVAADNQAVIDDSRIVFLSVRPQAAADVLKALKFDPGLTIISLIPFPLEATVPLVAPATRIFRVLPLPPCAHRLGAVPYWPHDEDVHGLLARLGQPMPLSGEHELSVLWAATAMIAPFFSLLETVSRWSAEQGVHPAAAADFTAAMFHALATVARAGAPERFSHLAAEAATPGGLNEQAAGMLRTGGALQHVREALDAILTRISRPPAAS
jgi:pyrroline-5-carboxylate reductase